MQITVTQDDINNGSPKRPMTCPIAHALERIYSFKSFGVTHDYIRLGDKHYYTPAIASLAVQKFDLGEGMEPFSFELDTSKEYDNELV